jgi:hypothetical protein
MNILNEQTMLEDQHPLMRLCDLYFAANKAKGECENASFALCHAFGAGHLLVSPSH